MSQTIADTIAAAYDAAGLTTEALEAAWPRAWTMHASGPSRLWRSGDATVIATHSPDPWFTGAEFSLSLLAPGYGGYTHLAVVQGTDFGALVREARARATELAKLVGVVP